MLITEKNIADNRKHWVAIEGKQYGPPDAFGVQTETWAPLWFVWAAIIPMTTETAAEELLTAESFASVATFQIGIRYRKGLKPTHRIRWIGPGFIYSIQSVLNLHKADLWHVLLCQQDQTNVST